MKRKFRPVRFLVSMNKRYMELLSGLLFLSSCGTIKDTPTFSDVDGEWNIVEVNGSPLTVKPDGQQPFIGFDIRSGKIYGNSGCNRIMASLDLQAKPGTVEFKQITGTLMTCPNMEMEKKVLGSLAQVKSYRKTGRNEIALCNSSNRPVVTLKKRFFPMSFTELQGEWYIVSVFNRPLPERIKKMPSLVFDTDWNAINGNTGCNQIVGNLKVNEDGKLSISIPRVDTKETSCPDMEVENNILSALSSVKTYGRLDREKIALYTSGGVQVLVLLKK